MKHFTKYKNIYSLILIVLLGGVLRLWGITGIPPSLYWDEVSQGFNAYTILMTGKDEHQEFMPLARFKAFGDYKAPVYIYTIVPFMQVFGKTDLSVRLPSAVFGTLTVFVTYFLTLHLFSSYKYKYLVASFSAFLLAISPWHIQLSRAAYEGNLATFFTVSGAWLFLRGKDGKFMSLVLSIFFFVLAFYAFNAHRVFIPLFVIFLSVLYVKDLMRMKKAVVLSLVIGIILLIPFGIYFMTPESKLRFNEVNIFSDLDVIKKSNERISYNDSSFISKIFDNRRVLYSLSYVHHYFDFFHPTYLFFSGDENPRFSLQSNGILYLWELPFLLVGFYLLLTNLRKESLVILGWFFLAPVVGATARETPHALRSETFIPTYQMISAFGISYLITVLIHSRFKRFFILFVVCLFLTIITSVYVFLHNYMFHFPRIYSGVWQYGYKQTVMKVAELEPDYEKIVFTKSFGRPYVYVAFYSDYSPEQFWSDVEMVRDPFGFYEVPRLGKYEFRETLSPEDTIEDNTLYIGSTSEIDETYQIIDTINTLDGKSSFIIAEKRK